ncbi:MAG: hypothetical protein V2A66_10945 [Pseudomonadota bacterium]
MMFFCQTERFAISGRSFALNICGVSCGLITLKEEITTMATMRVNEREGDILAVIRELESQKPAAKTSASTEPEVQSPDPHQLLASLKTKGELINLLNGYVDKTDIANMKKQLNEAIVDLEQIINTHS